MNILLLVSAALAAAMVAGHCTLGRRQFFLPMLEADFDATAKRFMSFVWHMSTVNLVLASAALFYAAFRPSAVAAYEPLAIYVAAQFILIGAVHLWLVSTSKLAGAVYKQFQWSLFFAVGITALAGA